MSTSDSRFVRALPASDLTSGETRCVKLGDKRKPVLLVRDGEQFFALEPWCSHAWQELDGGLVRDGWIACPAHGARFALLDGSPIATPASSAIATYEVRIADGFLEVAI